MIRTVGELRSALEAYPDDKDVYIAWPDIGGLVMPLVTEWEGMIILDRSEWFWEHDYSRFRRPNRERLS